MKTWQMPTPLILALRNNKCFLMFSLTFEFQHLCHPQCSRVGACGGGGGGAGGGRTRPFKDMAGAPLSKWHPGAGELSSSVQLLVATLHGWWRGLALAMAECSISLWWRPGLLQLRHPGPLFLGFALPALGTHLCGILFYTQPPNQRYTETNQYGN